MAMPVCATMKGTGILMSGEVVGQTPVEVGRRAAAVTDLDARLCALQRALDDLLEYTSDLGHVVDAAGSLVAVNHA